MSPKAQAAATKRSAPLPGFVDLTPFCGGPDKPEFLALPWTHGDFTYASDGNLLIRVPVRAEVPSSPHPISVTAAQLFAANPLPPLKAFARLPALPTQATAIMLGKRKVATEYLRKLSTLPAIHIAAKTGKWNDPLRFVFAGGDGLLMPLRK